MSDKEIEEYNSSYLLSGPAMLCPTTCERYVLRLDDLSFNGCHCWDQGFWWDENNFVVFAHWPRVVILFSICRQLLQILETISWVRNSGRFFVNKTCDSVPLSNSKQRNSLLFWTSNAAWSWSPLSNMRTTKSVVQITLWNLFWSLYEPLPLTLLYRWAVEVHYAQLQHMWPRVGRCDNLCVSRLSFGEDVWGAKPTAVLRAFSLRTDGCIYAGTVRYRIYTWRMGRSIEIVSFGL